MYDISETGKKNLCPMSYDKISCQLVDTININIKLTLRYNLFFILYYNMSGHSGVIYATLQKGLM